MKKQELRIGHLSTAYHTNFILMCNKEFQAEFNNLVKWILFGTGPSMIKAFNDGKLDIGYMGLPPAIIGIDNGIPIKCVAGGHVEGTLMIAKDSYNSLNNNDVNLKNVLKNFKGKRIGVPSKGSIHDVIINYYLIKYNLLNKVEVKNYPQAEFIALDMKKGLLDGGVGTPSLAIFSSTIQKTRIIIPPDRLWPYNPSYGIFFHEDIIKESPEIVLKFLKYHKTASILLQNNPLNAAKLISSSFKVLTQDYIKSVLEISPKYCIALSESMINSTMKFVQTLYELNYIKKKLEIEDIFNFKFIRIIHPEKEHY
ncbi:MAG: ABC transporter substrate-binding protein [Promethearchaeota archaeon]